MSLWNVFRRARSGSPAEFAAFLEGQAAFVAQKTVLDYCRVKMGRNDKRYFADPDFQAALEHCRWQVFFAAAADVVLLAEAVLRPLAAGREAALGADVSMPTPGGPVTVHVPPGSSTDRRLRLRGQGMPRRGQPGDLYARVKVVVPRTLSKKERELFEQLRDESSFDARRGS